MKKKLGLKLLKIAGEANIIFTAGPTNGRELGISIHIDLNFSFTPPITGQCPDPQYCSDKPAFSFPLGKDLKILFHGGRILPKEADMQPS